MSAADGSDRNAVVAQIRRSFVLQTPANLNSKLVLDSLGDVKPVQLVVQYNENKSLMNKKAVL